MSYLRDQWDVVNHARAAGTKGVLALLKFGEEKLGVLGELEPIASDVFKGFLVAYHLKYRLIGFENQS